MRYVLIFLAMALVAAPVALYVAVVEPRPAVASGHVPRSADAIRARDLMRELRDNLGRGGENVTVQASADDLNAVLGLVARTFPGSQTDLRIGADGLDGSLTMPLPISQAPAFLNLRFTLMPSGDGAPSAEISAGRLSLSGETALQIARLALTQALDESQTAGIFDAVEGVDFKSGALVLRVTPPTDLKQNLQQVASRLGEVRDSLALLGDPAVVGIYYARLIELEASAGGLRSLASYVGPVFSLAAQRSAERPHEEENRAALLALAMFFGNAENFEKMIGPVRSGELEGAPSKPGGATLHGRHDLVQHMLISAGLQIAARSGITNNIGEVKELLDSGKGGTGFSFVDLAADRTGVRLADVATGHGSAARLQAALASTSSETSFFPEIKGLPEGFTAAAFEARFGDIGSAAYQSMVQEIDSRIASIALYR